MSPSLASRIDARLGDGIELIVQAKHRRRLRRLGWQRALEPEGGGLYASGDPPPRAGCQVEMLVDGAQALPEMARAMLQARESVHLTGWHVSPWFELVRGESPTVLGTLLAELAERIDVRVLVWAGAPVPAFHPTRREVQQAISDLVRGTRIRCEPDPREHPFHCHHEKTIVIDGKLAFVGGIDLTTFGGDRFDSQRHAPRRRLGWHDAAARLERPAVADVHDHFLLRWRELTGERLDPPEAPAAAGTRTVQVIRTGRGHVRAAAAGRLQNPRELHPSTALGAAFHLPREPVPGAWGATIRSTCTRRWGSLTIGG